MRLQLFELEDLSWFPDVLRQSMLDYLRCMLLLLEYYSPAAPLLAEALQQTGDQNILDLCSGGGGAMEKVQQQLSVCSGKNVPVLLTDLYPNVQAYQLLEQRTQGKIRYVSRSVDATNVGSDLSGFRTMFSAVHHFPPEIVRKILQDAADARAGIALFDGGEKSLWTILGMVIMHPLLFVVLTPFLKPFRVSRLLFTYVIPLIPLCTMWDGIVSVLRLYSLTNLKEIADGVIPENYEWRTGKAVNRLGLKMTYLIGYPTKNLVQGST